MRLWKRPTRDPNNIPGVTWPPPAPPRPPGSLLIGSLAEHEIDTLARYNAERSRGLIHTPDWDARMAELQQRFNAGRPPGLHIDGTPVTEDGAPRCTASIPDIPLSPAARHWIGVNGRHWCVLAEHPDDAHECRCNMRWGTDCLG